MSYTNDSKGSGTSTNESEVNDRLRWSEAHRTWANSHFKWSSPNANFTNDSEPALWAGQTIVGARIGSTFIIRDPSSSEQYYKNDEKA